MTEELSQRSPALLFLFTVILAPLFEEILYRYGIISNLRGAGGRNAVLFSAVVFSLGHQNIFQLFYTFFAGIIFGYIYIFVLEGSATLLPCTYYLIFLVPLFRYLSKDMPGKFLRIFLYIHSSNMLLLLPGISFDK